MKKEAAQPEKHRTALFFNENIFLFDLRFFTSASITGTSVS